MRKRIKKNAWEYKIMQASGEVQVSMETEVSHCHLLAKRRAAYRRRNETCTETEKDEMRKLKR